MNWIGVKAIYLHEMDRMRRTIIQSILSLPSSQLLFILSFLEVRLDLAYLSLTM